MGSEILKRFYSCAMTGCITAWYGNCLVSDPIEHRLLARPNRPTSVVKAPLSLSLPLFSSSVAGQIVQGCNLFIYLSFIFVGQKPAITGQWKAWCVCVYTVSVFMYDASLHSLGLAGSLASLPLCPASWLMGNCVVLGGAEVTTPQQQTESGA